MYPRVKTEVKCNKSVNNEFKIMKKSNSLNQIRRVNNERANNETNSPYSCLFIHYFDIMNSLKSDKTHYILI